VLVGPHPDRTLFGLGDRSFNFTVRLAHDSVMPPAGRVLFRLMTIDGAVPPTIQHH
jgi:hypothetical protein